MTSPLFPTKNKNIISRIIENSAIQISIMRLLVTGILAILHVNPRTKSILNILLPTILPIAISACFFSEAITQVTSSGAEVQKATIVKPIIDSGTLNETAIFTAELMSKSAPSASHVSHKTMSHNDTSVLCSWFVGNSSNSALPDFASQKV